MALHNPHRDYDQGMDDAYMGIPSKGKSGQYNEGYAYALSLNDKEEQKRMIKEYEREMEREYYTNGWQPK